MTMQTEADMIRAYQQARSIDAADAALVLLCIGETASVLVSGEAGASPGVRILPFGAGAIASPPFSHDPPTPFELENAIAVIEDELMPLPKTLPSPAALVVAGEPVRPLVQLIGGRESASSVTREAVENLFQELATISASGHAGSSGMPTARHFAGMLLILREFMHHLGFATANLAPALYPRDLAMR
ncbi:hypothetical protein [Niveibacterium sp.]|uniref:hypothetical protein n=1 Tax=Niveibacterium sp. TaxID=2017444 RepID=UPI0035AEDA28